MCMSVQPAMAWGPRRSASPPVSLCSVSVRKQYRSGWTSISFFCFYYDAFFLYLLGGGGGGGGGKAYGHERVSNFEILKVSLWNK